MKVVEILKLGRIWLEMLQESCIKVEDVRFIAMYDEFCALVGDGNKKSYAVTFLSEKYGISERQVYYILKRLSSDCNFRAGI